MSRNGGSLVKRFWVHGVAVLVVLLVAVAINRIGGLYYQTTNGQASPKNAGDVVKFNPKRVTFELSGDLGSGGQATYLDVDSQPHNVVLTSLPWSYTETTMLTTVAARILARVEGGSLTCRILVDGVPKRESTLANPGAAVECTVLSA